MLSLIAGAAKEDLPKIKTKYLVLAHTELSSACIWIGFDGQFEFQSLIGSPVRNKCDNKNAEKGVVAGRVALLVLPLVSRDDKSQIR